jgi:NAD(P)-dependent dehydrogenase (short-subunit alcohol dehydrogenase family)
MKRSHWIVTLAAGLAAFAATAAPAAEGDKRMPTVLITGSNRGIGLEFVKQYAEGGWNVIATARDPAKAHELQALAKQHRNVTLEKLDVSNEAEIDALAKKYAGRPIDVLLNNAGWLGEPAKQNLQNLDYATFEEVLKVNTYAPLRISQAFLPNVEAGQQKKIIVITSGLSSITNTMRGSGLYYYRASKAGVNIVMRTLQSELRPKGITVGIMAPGMVETRLLRASGYGGRGLTPEDSVKNVIRNIDNLNDQEAKNILYDGSVVPW